MSPQLIFGTASLGMDQTAFQDELTVTSLLQVLEKQGVNRLDTGARYPPLNPGRSEELIGLTKDVSSTFLVDTKVYTDTRTDGSGDLTAESIEKSVRGSLARLGRQTEGVNTLHIHRADPSTPVRDQVLAFNEQIKKGHCKAWGVSNVPLTMLEDMFRVCEEEGLQKPSCYQGDYNIMTRGMEAKLLPLLREHGASFNAFRSLAAGFMSGKYLKGETEGTRFGEDNPLGKPMQKLFGGDDLRSAMGTFDTKVSAKGLTTIEVAIRWIMYHSALGDDDGVLLGASKETHIEQNMALIRKGPLPPDMLAAADELWAALKASRSIIM